jgi:RimJ/RimL family protein N-acetyltransferase
MKLVSVYDVPDSVEILYELLRERRPEESISHKRMPTFECHKAFVEKRPYFGWCLIEVNGEYVGATYLSKEREIGIWIFAAYRGQGYGKQAVQEMMKRFPGEFKANINPQNDRSINMFKSMGFKHIQNTYELEQT